MRRRQFLKVGFVGGAMLAAGGAFVVWRDVRNADYPEPPRDRVAAILGAVAPALLGGTLPVEPSLRAAAIARVIADVKAVVAGFPDAVRNEVNDLFRTLDIRIARRVLTGVSSDWTTADPGEVAAFLERWRRSRIGLLQSGYFALHDLVLGAWYADSSTWDAIRYPGPPNVE